MILLMEGVSVGKNLVNGGGGRAPTWGGGTVWQFRENS